MLCPACGTSIPFYQGSSPTCGCGWSGKKRADASNMGLIIGALVVAGVIAAWLLYQVNVHQFQPDDTAADKHFAAGQDFLAKENWPNAILELEQAEKYNPKRADVHYQLYYAHKKNNEMGEALEQMKEAAALKPDDYKMQQVYGEALEQSDEQDKALDQFLKVSKQFPHDYVCLEHAALCAERLGNNDRAVDLWYEALKLNKKAGEGWINLARIAFRENRPDEAIKVLKSGLEKNPKNASMYYHLGVSYNDIGHKEEALAALHKCVELEPAYTGYVGDLIANISTNQKRPLYLIPMQGSEGGLTIEAVLNEKRRVRLLVDSGATITVVSRKAAEDLGMKLGQLPDSEFKSVTGAATAKTTVLNTVRIGQARAKNVRILIYDEYAGSAEGLLGMTFLEQFKFTIDAKRKQLTLIPR